MITLPRPLPTSSLIMQSLTIDGYVHKFRLEACEEAAAEKRPQPDSAPTVSLGGLLGKFALSAIALAGIAAAGANALI